MGLYGILRQRTFLKTLAFLFLALISMRGMMCMLLLFLFDLVGNAAFWVGQRALLNRMVKRLPAYLPAGILAMLFLLYHYQQTGWIGYHTDSPWAPSFEKVDASGFAWNLGILGWRLSDFGRVFEWIALLAGIVLLWRRDPALQLEFLPWLLLLIFSLLILSPSLLLHKYLSAHRYLLPVFLALHLAFCNS